MFDIDNIKVNRKLSRNSIPNCKLFVLFRAPVFQRECKFRLQIATLSFDFILLYGGMHHITSPSIGIPKTS